MQVNLLSIITFVILTFPFLYFCITCINVINGGYVNMLLYIAGLLISLLFGLLLIFGLGRTGNKIFLRRDSFFVRKLGKWFVDTGKGCSIIDVPKIFGYDLSKYSVISLYTLFYGYTWSYLVLGGKFSNQGKWDGNDTITTILILLFTLVHSAFQLNRKCFWPYEGVFGFLFGLVFGILWFNIVKPDLKSKLAKQHCGLGRNGVWSCQGKYTHKIKERELTGNDYLKFVYCIGIICTFYTIAFYIAK